MARRVLFLLVLVLAAAAPALAGDGLGKQKATLDGKLAALQATIARAHTQESTLSSQIGGLTTQIHTLESKVGDVSTKLAALQADLTLHQRRLVKLNQLYRLQNVRFRDLRREYAISVQRLDLRLVAIYKQSEPSTVDVLLAARSFHDLLDEFDYLGAIAAQDKRVAAQVATAQNAVRLARARTAKVRSTVEDETRIIDARTQQQAILRGQLLSSQNRLTTVRAGKSTALVATRAQEEDAIKESQAIQAASAAIEAKLKATDGTGAGVAATPSAAGLIWPVSGPITSPFGPRWGGFHPGIDIGVPTGTPIHAAAAGTVIYCGWEEGYGNLVVIDHHNGLATAYGHQSRIVSTCGENVAQGQVIGYSGCTGFCTGPHVHFEVRVNGTPVDPIGYLP
jgi:murein DD-endopeptidase MepM/ murein hydrolase activator NlpD